ncbi:MAG: diphosphomevalonate decarboxylase [Anaerolineae bacterium]
MRKATAVAHPNIAFVKYWGKADEGLNLPANPSLSMNLAALTTVTTVEFRPGWREDAVTIDHRPVDGQSLARVVAHLDRVRAWAGIGDRAQVASVNNFPAGVGLASSASAFAALSLAATQAAGLALSEAALSRLARLGSGSACRSVPAGFTIWEGETDETSWARQVAPPDSWNLQDVVAIVERRPKTVGSSAGHALARTSPFYAARLAWVPELLAAAYKGIQERDLIRLGAAAEADALAMHAVMMTSQPPLLYWQPATVRVMQAVRAWRDEGLPVYFTIDAGPNVHCLCLPEVVEEVKTRLQNLPGVQNVLVSGPGGGVRLTEHHLF